MVRGYTHRLPYMPIADFRSISSKCIQSSGSRPGRCFERLVTAQYGNFLLHSYLPVLPVHLGIAGRERRPQRFLGKPR